MAGITDLADEILLEIGCRLSVWSLQQFALVSRQFLGPAQEALYRHPVLGACLPMVEPRPSKNNYSECVRTEQSICALIRTLFCHPALASTVRSFSLNIPIWNYEYETVDDTPPEISQLLPKALQFTGGIQYDTSAWDSALSTGNIVAWAALLVALTPNIRALSVAADTEGQPHFPPIIAETDRETRSSMANIAEFSSINRLSMTFPFPYLEDWIHLPALQCHSGLGSGAPVSGLNTLDITCFPGVFLPEDKDVDPWPRNSLTTHYFDKTPQLKKIRLRVTNDSEFSEWVALCEDDDYDDDRVYTEWNTPGTGYWTRGQAIVPIPSPDNHPACYGALFERLGPLSAHLESLSITCDRSSLIAVEPVVDVQNFTALKYLEIPSYALDHWDDVLGRTTVPLPPNIEELCISYPSRLTRQALEYILTSLSQVPKLRNIFINTRTQTEFCTRAVMKELYDSVDWNGAKQANVSVHFDASVEELECWRQSWETEWTAAWISD